MGEPKSRTHCNLCFNQVNFCPLVWWRRSSLDFLPLICNYIWCEFSSDVRNSTFQLRRQGEGSDLILTVMEYLKSVTPLSPSPKKALIFCDIFRISFISYTLKNQILIQGPKLEQNWIHDRTLPPILVYYSILKAGISFVPLKSEMSYLGPE